MGVNDSQAAASGCRDIDVELMKKENEALKKEVAQLKSKVSELETRLGEKPVVCKVCQTHHWNSVARDCGGTEDGWRCPLQPPSTATYQDLIPDVLDVIFSNLDSKSILACRQVCKAWKSHFNFVSTWLQMPES